jgi:hypothetical protein
MKNGSFVTVRRVRYEMLVKFRINPKLCRIQAGLLQGMITVVYECVYDRPNQRVDEWLSSCMDEGGNELNSKVN